MTEKIVFGTNNPIFLERAMAQEIFLNFLVAFTEEIQTLQGYTQRVYTDHCDQWQNSTLVSLMATLLASGLVLDIFEAQYLITSPFLKAGLLPTRLSSGEEGDTSREDDDIIERAKQNSQEYVLFHQRREFIPSFSPSLS
jgi:arylamine N-acetyltransferase